MRIPAVLGGLLAAAWLAALPAAAQDARPNVVVFLADDLGYADLPMYGHPTIQAPSLERMAREGVRLTSLYSQPSCTPSRAALLTGRYPFRSNLLLPIGPGSPLGLQPYEVTLAEALKERGYRTAVMGKWHLGDTPAFNPLRHGFDEYFGIPYSHDYRPPFVADAPPVPLYRGLEVVERPVEEATLTRRITEEAVRFIRESRGRPFFLYVAHPLPHLPAVASPEFRGRSRAGRYGDVIEELDWSMGQILATLAELGLDGNTITVFTSDNGPWLNAQPRSYQEGQTIREVGYSGVFRDSKASTYEGGVRVPGIVRWPGTIPAGRVSAEPVSQMDLYPTLLRLAGARVPDDRPVDGVDVLEHLTGRAPSPRGELFYMAGAALHAVRAGSWKLRIAPVAGGAAPTVELYQLDSDPGERLNVAEENPGVVERLRARLEAFRAEVAAARPG